MVELEGGLEQPFTEPQLGEGGEQPLVEVVGDAAAVERLADHVAHRRPRNTLRVPASPPKAIDHVPVPAPATRPAAAPPSVSPS